MVASASMCGQSTMLLVSDSVRKQLYRSASDEVHYAQSRLCV